MGTSDWLEIIIDETDRYNEDSESQSQHMFWYVNGRSCDNPGVSDCFGDDVNRLEMWADDWQWVEGSVEPANGDSVIHHQTLWASDADASDGCEPCGNNANAHKASLVKFGNVMSHWARESKVTWESYKPGFDSNQEYAGVSSFVICLRPPPVCEAPNSMWYSEELLSLDPAFDVTGIAQPENNLSQGDNVFPQLYPDGDNGNDYYEYGTRIGLPWDFQYFCEYVNDIWVTHSGVVAFSTNMAAYGPRNPVRQPPNSFSWWWSRWNPRTNGDYFLRKGSDRVDILAQNVESDGGDAHITFGYTLHEDGTIDMHYIGAENSDTWTDIPPGGSFLNGPQKQEFTIMSIGTRRDNVAGRETAAYTLRYKPLVEVFVPAEETPFNWVLAVALTVAGVAVMAGGVYYGMQLRETDGDGKKAAAAAASSEQPSTLVKKGSSGAPLAGRKRSTGSRGRSGSKNRPRAGSKNSKARSRGRSGSGSGSKARPRKRSGSGGRSGAVPAAPSDPAPPMPEHKRPPTSTLEMPEVIDVLDDLASSEAAARRAAE